MYNVKARFLVHTRARLYNCLQNYKFVVYKRYLIFFSVFEQVHIIALFFHTIVFVKHNGI